ncbi:MAG: EVE domain-containing protein [Legionellales bacterium RIFCSPHIGHO2_12_FULL_37_14]|nr:MAG: EVE domain-containing protein [Legionellales bacterium RIFCSPHIGHO2_12_FULL_37_14]
MQSYWLMKSEPSCFSIDDLINAPKQTTCWDGVRNYQARNFMRDRMSIKDKVLFYHSNCSKPAIVGIAEVTSKAYPDHTAFDPNSDHPDLSTSPSNPRWYMVDIKFKEKLNTPLTLEMLKNYPPLVNMILLRKGNRLSVLPVTPNEWKFLMSLKESLC